MGLSIRGIRGCQVHLPSPLSIQVGALHSDSSEVCSMGPWLAYGVRWVDIVLREIGGRWKSRLA